MVALTKSATDMDEESQNALTQALHEKVTLKFHNKALHIWKLKYCKSQNEEHTHNCGIHQLQESLYHRLTCKLHAWALKNITTISCVPSALFSTGRESTPRGVSGHLLLYGIYFRLRNDGIGLEVVGWWGLRLLWLLFDEPINCLAD